MILTYKIKHNRDFSYELDKAMKIAKYSLVHKKATSKDVKNIGLKSAIANQILRKYGHNKKIKRVSNVKLIVPSQSIKDDKTTSTINIACLKLSLPYLFSGFTKINQIELDNEYAYVAVTIPENPEIVPDQWIGVDLNTTGHCAVASCSDTGKVLKLGKSAYHIHKKYKNQRKKLQKKGKLRLVNKIGHRESLIVRDINHKISRKVVDYAAENKAGIVLEDLTNIRKSKKNRKSFKYSLHSWSFYQMRNFIEYKAKLLGIPVVKIDPRYTSQQCSLCGLLGNRNSKHFKCPHCGHVEDADVNASFVIGLRHQGILRLPKDRDFGKGNTDIPKKATVLRTQTLKP
jgi:putative transposase